MKTLKSIIFSALAAVLPLVAGAQVRTLQLYKGGQISQEIKVQNIDSIKFVKILDAPASLSAVGSTENIKLTWTAVNLATSYEVWRSDGEGRFVKIASAVNATEYVDTNPIKGNNIYKVCAVGADCGGMMSAPTQTIAFTGNLTKSGLYMGVSGFGDTLTKKPIASLSKNTKVDFTDFVLGLKMSRATLLHYGVEQAINDMQGVELPEDLSSVYLVTFTDGLDQGSTMENPSYTSDEQYLAALNNRINTENVRNIPITAFSIGVMGNDVSYKDKFTNTLEHLASPGNNFLVNNMSEVNTKFQEIAESLITMSYTQTVNVTIPGLSDGTRIRFTFDNVSNAANSTKYIEGTLNRADFSLKDVTYVGVTSTSGSQVAGTRDGIYLTYTFAELAFDDGNTIDMSKMNEWQYLSDISQWQRNSEFSTEDDLNVIVNRKSVVVMLVLDCSKSLGSDFEKMQGYARDFINKLADSRPDDEEETGGNTNPGGNGNEEEEIPDTENTINGHEFVDLGLSVKWATCNVGANNTHETGGYYCWGEIEEKSKYDSDTYTDKFNNLSNITGNPNADVCTAKWGSKWRMPTKADWDELMSCKRQWTSQKGIYGYKITGKNGNSIFLPVTGRKYNSGLSYTSEGYYRCADNIGSSFTYACWFDSGLFRVDTWVLNRSYSDFYKYYGMCVRPVSDY